MRRLSDFSSIALFIFGSYLISWSIWIYGFHSSTVFHLTVNAWTVDIPSRALIGLLGTIGPGVSATLVLGFTEGWESVRGLWKGLTVWNLNPVWLVFVCLFIPLVCAVALFVYWRLGGSVAPVGNPARWLLLIAVNLPFTPIWEEIGWRGFSPA